MGKETDFLILWDGKPWMLVEAKLSDQPIDSHYFHHADALGLGKIPIVQLIRDRGVTRKERTLGYAISASRFLSA